MRNLYRLLELPWLTPKTRGWLAFCSILLLCGLHVLILWRWLEAHVLPNGYQNEIFHLDNALELYLAVLRWDRHVLHGLLFEQYWPPLPSLVGLPFMHFGELSRNGLVLSGSVWLCGLLLGVYLLGARVSSRTTGWLAALLLALFPSIYGNLRHFEPNVALTATCVLSLYALVRSHHFVHRGWSVCFGLSAGLALLTDRLSALFFLLGPCALVAWEALLGGKHPVRRRRRVIGALCLAGVACLAVCGYFYWNFFRLYTSELLPQATVGEILSTGERSEFRDPWALSSWTFYLATLLDSQVGFGLGLLLLPGLFLALRRPEPGSRVLWVALGVPLLLFSLIQKKQLYYTIPLLPWVALLAAEGIGRVRGTLKGVWIGGLLLVGTHQLLLTSFGMPILPERVVVPLSVPVLLDLGWLGGRSPLPEAWVSPRYPQSTPPMREDLRVPELLHALGQVKPTPPGFRILTFSEDSLYFEGYLSFFVHAAYPHATVNGLIQNPIGFYENLKLLDALVYVSTTDHTFPTEGSVREALRARGQERDLSDRPILAHLLALEPHLEAVASLPLSHGAVVHVLRRKGWGSRGESTQP